MTPPGQNQPPPPGAPAPPGVPPASSPESSTAMNSDADGGVPAAAASIPPSGSSNTCWNLRVSAEADKGGRRYMEDVALVDFRRENNIEYAVFGVFDGHGGKQASRFAKAHLMNFIRQQKSFWSSRPENVKRAIHAGFIACHEAMRRKLPHWPKTVLGYPCTAGSTASIAIIRGNKLYVAYVGDSGMVLGYEKNGPPSQQDQNAHQNLSLHYGSASMQVAGQNTFSEQKQCGPAYSATSTIKPKTNFYYRELTTDHKPESVTEKRRIEAVGGSTAIKNGVNRVIWNRARLSDHYGQTEYDRIPFLAVARSLGDLWSYNPANNEFVVSPVPDIDVIDLTKPGETARFMIVASDGVWNMIRPWDAVHMVATFKVRKEANKTDGSPAHDIVRQALSRWRLRGLRADNTSAVVVWLDRAPGVSSEQFESRAWSSDAPADRNSIGGIVSSSTAQSNASSGLGSSQGSSGSSLSQSEQCGEEDEDENEISLDLDAGYDLDAARYPSMKGMKKYADMSIPRDMLNSLISDDEDEDEISNLVAIPVAPSATHAPLQYNEVSATTVDEDLPTSSTAPPVPLKETNAVSVIKENVGGGETIVTTTTTTVITEIARRKRTSSDLDAEEMTVSSSRRCSSNASDPLEEDPEDDDILRHTPKRKKSDTDPTGFLGDSTPGSVSRRSRRLKAKSTPKAPEKKPK